MDNEYIYTQNIPASDDPALTVAGMAFFLAFLAFFLLMFVISYVVCSILLGRIFKKTGLSQWIAWVPVYNVWKILELGKQQGYWALLGLLPFVGIISLVYLYMAMYSIGKQFGKDDWFVALAIVVPVVWLGILAFDDSRWPSAKKAKSAEPAHLPPSQHTKS